MGLDLGIGEIASIASLAGTGASAIGAITGGYANAASARYGAAVARNNAVIANQNANYATAAGERQSFDQALSERQRAGAIKASIGAHGINVNEGSPVDVEASNAELGQEDVETVRQKAALANYGYRTVATNYGAQATLDTAQAANDVSAGWLKGLGGLLSAAPDVGKFGKSLFGSSTSTIDPDLGIHYDQAGAVA